MLDESVDRRVGERRQLDRLPVIVPAVRDGRIACRASSSPTPHELHRAPAGDHSRLRAQACRGWRRADQHGSEASGDARQARALPPHPEGSGSVRNVPHPTSSSCRHCSTASGPSTTPSCPTKGSTTVPRPSATGRPRGGPRRSPSLGSSRAGRGLPLPAARERAQRSGTALRSPLAQSRRRQAVVRLRRSQA